ITKISIYILLSNANYLILAFTNFFDIILSRNAMKKLVIKLIKAYQKNYPYRGKCRYSPTCSAYALACFEKFNFFKASFLSIKRILKCNPLFKGGHDPVPLSKQEKQDSLK